MVIGGNMFDNIKLQLRLIDGQLSREWGQAKNE